MRRLLTLTLCVCGCFWSLKLFAAPSVDEFLKKIKTVTYDCPDPNYESQLKELLNSPSSNATERFRLSVMQTHYQNCSGQIIEAQKTLKEIVNDASADKESRYFASANYQLGFTFDVQEQDERCDYYSEALRLSKDRYQDIEMSSTLGLITNCEEAGYSNDSKRLAGYFALIEKYADADDPKALAHIHNSIGLFFGSRQQHVLAADQYLKAHELGKDVYTSNNRLAILISAITSLLSSSQFDKAYEAINEFEELNTDVNTPLSNFWYYYAKSSYYYRTEKIENLEQTLPELAAILPAVDNAFYRGLYRWYSAVPCLYKQDIECLKRFTEIENSLSDSEKPYENYHYNKFIIRANLAIGDIESASRAFEKNIQQLDAIKENRNGLAEVIGIANLYGQIYVLENEILVAERRKRQLIVFGIVAFTLSFGVLIYVLRKRQIARRSIDPSTQLLNSKSAIDLITKTELPSEGNINALAIFDLGNFREVNLKIGSTKGDYVLKSIARTLKEVTRKNDVLGRFAPEQFILCLKDIEESSAKSFFERVQEALEGTFAQEEHEKEISVRSSMSIYITNEPFDDINTILEEMLLSLSIKPNNLRTGFSDTKSSIK